MQKHPRLPRNLLPAIAVLVGAVACGAETRDTSKVGDAAGGGSGAGAIGVAGGGQAGWASSAGAAGAGGTDTIIEPCASDPPMPDDCPMFNQKYTSKPGEGRPPAPSPGAPPAAATEPVRFVADRFSFGDETPEAWKALGYNLDGFTSNRDFPGHCQSISKQAKTKIRTDGDDGIDNAFAQIVLPSGALPLQAASQKLTDQVRAGNATFLIAFDGLGEAAAYANVTAKLLPVKMPTGVAPTFSPADAWSPLLGGELAVVSFTGGYLTAHTWVSGASAKPLSLELFVGDFPLRLRIHAPLITAELSPDHTTIERGVVAGLLVADELVEGLRPHASSLALCDTAFDAIADNVRNACDSLRAGGQDPTKTCDAISIGFAFTGKRVGELGPPIDRPLPIDGCEKPAPGP